MLTTFSRTIVTLFILWLPMNVAAFAVPLPDGFVRDDAGLLTIEEEQELESIVSTQQIETSQEISILIVPTLYNEVISDVAYQVFTKWGIGQKETNNGLLMLIAVQDKNIWITTGRGLEGVLPDILVKKIIDTEIFPSFKTGAYANGIKNGIYAIQKVTAGEYAPIQSNSSRGAFFMVLLFFSIIAGCIFLIVYTMRATGLHAKKIQLKEVSKTGPIYTQKETNGPNSYTIFATNNSKIFAQHTSEKVSNTFSAIATTPPLIAPSLFKQRYLRILDIFIIIILVAKTERQARLFSLFFLLPFVGITIHLSLVFSTVAKHFYVYIIVLLGIIVYGLQILAVHWWNQRHSSRIRTWQEEMKKWREYKSLHPELYSNSSSASSSSSFSSSSSSSSFSGGSSSGGGAGGHW